MNQKEDKQSNKIKRICIFPIPIFAEIFYCVACESYFYL